MNIQLQTIYEYKDYIPGISTATSLVDIFLKYVVIPLSSTNNHYYTHVKNKSIYRCLTLLVPVIGNIVIYFLDRSRSIDEGLDAWLANPFISGNKEEAVQRIKSAKQSLNLEKLELNQLPPEICKLTNLTKLCLMYNRLTSLPTEIARLTTLKHLDLMKNQLTSLPIEIGQLTSLSTLILNSNAITSLPREIGKLTNLTKLKLISNKIRSLPTEIGLLTRLTCLEIDHNQLTSLPQELGNLINITDLYLTCNPNLSEMPMNLGQIPDLTYIDISNTQIDQDILDAILNQSRMMRDAEAVKILPFCLAKWKAIAKSAANFEINELSDEQKKNLNEWLRRLEKTKEFVQMQSALAATVCRIVADAIQNKEFQELFFIQAEANNRCCEDRAAMALNEIYSSWMILCNSADLQIMKGVAKTVTLRKELQKLINKQPKASQRESVEIFLYYETTLRDRLHLVTAIQNMTYGLLGKRDWINENALVQTVNNQYFEELIELPVFEKMMKQQWDEIDAELYSQLGDCPQGDPYDPEVLNYNVQQGEIMQERKKRRILSAKYFS